MSPHDEEPEARPFNFTARDCLHAIERALGRGPFTPLPEEHRPRLRPLRRASLLARRARRSAFRRAKESAARTKRTPTPEESL